MPPPPGPPEMSVQGGRPQPGVAAGGLAGYVARLVSPRCRVVVVVVVQRDGSEATAASGRRDGRQSVPTSEVLHPQQLQRQPPA